MIHAKLAPVFSLGVFAFAFALGGCGGDAKAPTTPGEPPASPAVAAPESKAEAPAPPPPPPPPVVSSSDHGGDAASDVAAIAAAKAQIDALLGAPADKGKGTGSKRAEAAAGAAGQAAPCASACAALSSMTRATDHLCALAGDADARCADARAKTKSATERVHAGCPACP